MYTDTEKKLVFICSPYSGNVDENVKNARRYCREELTNDPNAVPIAPHLLFPQFLNDSDEKERDAGMSCGIELLKACDEIHVFPGKSGRITDGMRQEIAVAEYFGKTIKYCADRA